MDADSTTIVWAVCTVFFAVMVQGIVGFGSALIAAPLLIRLLSPEVAIPLITLVGVAQQSVLWTAYRKAFNWQATARLTLASIVTIPAGVVLLTDGSERMVLGLLGLITIGYALWELARFQLPELASPRWAYLFGGIAGLLSGAYNISGPPVVLYANCRRWPPEEFKGNLQGFFLVNSALVLLSRGLQQQLTSQVWLLGIAALPAIALGGMAGVRLARRLDPHRFRQLILLLLIFLGGSLLR
ncbi:MAG: sulfite exporter TauE/SafE family protein [Cyanobacteria bacterium P01_A01_bin.135]